MQDVEHAAGAVMVETKRVPLYHQIPWDPPVCGQVALYLVVHPAVGDEMLAEHFELPDGQKPRVGDPLVCGSCGRGLRWPFELDADVWDAGRGEV